MEHPNTPRVRDDPAVRGQASLFHALASEYLRMAAAVDTPANMQALANLAKGYTALAEQAEAEDGAAAAATTEPDRVVVPVSSKRPHVGQRVLVVDDTVDVLVAVGAFLVGEGFVVVFAADGDTALRLIASDPQINVLITDYAMPGLSGVELITQAIQMRADLKALLITGYPNADGLAELPSHIKVLTKPFRRAILTAQVKALVSDAAPMLPNEATEPVEFGQVEIAF